MTKKYDESVLVVEDKYFDFLKDPIVDQSSRMYSTISSYGTFLDRNLAEIHMNYRQIIPYVFITDIIGNVLFYNRKSGDGRLLHKYSIGFGGHINEKDKVTNLESGMLDSKLTIHANILRELSEELSIQPGPDDLSFYGKYICNDTTEVDKMHLGMVYHLKAKNLQTIVFNRNYNTEEMELDLCNLKHAGTDIIFTSKLENWSKEVLSYINVY